MSTVLMIMSNFKHITMSGLIVIFLTSINAVRAEDAPVAQEKIPPAPLGPYISTGLLVSEADAPATETLAIEAPPVEVLHTQNPPTAVPGNATKAILAKPVVQVGKNKMPMAAFSPDIPWPADMRPSASSPSGRWAPNQMMPGYDSRQISPEKRQQQSRSPHYRASVANNPAYSRRLTVPQAVNQQMPSSYLPQNNFSSGYPGGNMPNPYYYQPGYSN